MWVLHIPQQFARNSLPGHCSITIWNWDQISQSSLIVICLIWKSKKMLTVFSPISYKLFLQVNLLFGEHGEYMLCTEIILNVKNNFCTQQVLSMFWNGIFMYWTCNSMNNLLSCCGLVDAKIRASDKDLPVHRNWISAFSSFLLPSVVSFSTFGSFGCFSSWIWLFLVKSATLAYTYVFKFDM